MNTDEIKILPDSEPEDICRTVVSEYGGIIVNSGIRFLVKHGKLRNRTGVFVFVVGGDYLGEIKQGSNGFTLNFTKKSRYNLKSPEAKAFTSALRLSKTALFPKDAHWCIWDNARLKFYPRYERKTKAEVRELAQKNGIHMYNKSIRRIPEYSIIPLNISNQKGDGTSVSTEHQFPLIIHDKDRNY